MKIENVIIDGEIIPHVDGVNIEDLSDEELRNIQLRLASRMRTGMIDRRKMKDIVWALTLYMGELDKQTDLFAIEI